MKKTTKEYAEKLAEKYIDQNYVDWAKSDPATQNSKDDYREGYMKAIEENAVPELIEALSYAYQAIEKKWDDGLGMHFGNQPGNIKTKRQIREIMVYALKKATE